jgi:hypothetical protein
VGQGTDKLAAVSNGKAGFGYWNFRRRSAECVAGRPCSDRRRQTFLEIGQELAANLTLCNARGDRRTSFCQGSSSMLKEVSSVIATVSAIGAVIIGMAVAWERNQQYTNDLERRIEMLENVLYREHPEYTLAIYLATGRGPTENAAVRRDSAHRTR